MSDFSVLQMQRISKHVHRAGDHFRTHKKKYLTIGMVMTAFFAVMFIWGIGGNIHKASAGSDSVPTGWAVESSGGGGSELTTSAGSTNDSTAKAGLSVELYQHGSGQLGFYPTGITGLAPGDSYQLKFWAKGTGDLDVKIDDGSGNLYNFTGGLANTYTPGSSSDQKFSILTAGGTPPMTLHSDEFQQYMTETAFTVPSTGVLKPIFVPVNNSDYVYLDSVTLYKVAYAPGPPTVITPEGSDLMSTHNGDFDDWSAVNPVTSWRADGLTLVEQKHPDDVNNSVANIIQGNSTGTFSTEVDNLIPGDSYSFSFKGITSNGSSVATLFFNGDFTQAFNFTSGAWSPLIDDMPTVEQFYALPEVEGSRALGTDWDTAVANNPGTFVAPADGKLLIIFIPLDGSYSDPYAAIHAGDAVSLDDVTLQHNGVGDNLVFNGDFEDWLGGTRPDNWYFSGDNNSDIRIVHPPQADANTGTSSIRLSEGNLDVLGYMYSNGVSGLNPGDYYELTFQAKGNGDLDSIINDGSGFGFMNLYNFDTGLYDSWGDISVPPSANQRNRVTLTSSYQLFTVSFPIGSGTSVSAMFAPVSSGGYVYLDDISIKKVTNGFGGRGDNILASLNPGFEDWSLGLPTILDLTSPTIASSSPSSAATGVLTTVHPTITFDKAINPATISAGTIHLSPATPVSSVTLSDDGLTATIFPTAPLAANTIYTVHLESGIHDMSHGNALVTTSFSFTTGLSILSVSPLNSASDVSSTNTSAISATFNETISLVDPGDFQVETYDTNLGDYVVNYSVGVVSANGDTLTLAPTNNTLSPGTIYRITVKSTFGAGTSGNTLSDNYTWQFTTASASSSDNQFGTSPVIFSSTQIPGLPTTNGNVYAVATGSDNKLYIGGSFTEVNGQSRHGLAAMGDGGVLSDWDPGLDSGAIVYALAAYGDNIIAGGDFTYLSKENLVAFADANGAFQPTFAVENPNYPVRAILVDSGDSVIIGGDFTAVGENSYCSHIAAYKFGEPLICSDYVGMSSFTTNGSVRALAVKPNSDGGEFLVAGGNFTQAGGLPHFKAALWLLNDSPSLSTWNPLIIGIGVNVGVNAIAFDNVNSILYLGGNFTLAGGISRNNLAAYNFDQDGIPLDTYWNPNIGGGLVKTIVVNNAAVYVGGSFTTVNGGTTRSGLASFERANGTSATGTTEEWAPILSNIGKVDTLLVATDMIVAGGEFADQGYIVVYPAEGGGGGGGGILPADENGNYLCDLGGTSWDDMATVSGFSHIFFRTTQTGDLGFGYGYGYTAGHGWKYGFGFGYGYDTFCGQLGQQFDGSRAGYFFFESTPSPTMNLAAVLDTETEVHSVSVPDDITLSLSGEGEGSELLLPANMTMGAASWDGTVAVTFNTTSVPTGMSSGTVVDVDFGGVSGQPIKLSGAALVVIPQAGFNPSTGLVKIIGTDGLPYVAGECSGEQYSGGNKAVVGSYALGNYFTGAVSAQQCYTYDSTKVYVATNHFSSFSAGTATVVADSTPTTNGGLPAPTPLMVGKIQTLVQEHAAQSSSGSSSGPNSTNSSVKKVDSFPPNSLRNFKDLLTLGRTKWQYPVIQQMLELGLMNGSTDAKGDKYWRMNANMTRSEAAVLIARYAGFDDKKKITSDPFADVAKNEWYAASVDYLKTLGVISGKTPTAFEPEAKITRMEFFKIVVSTYMELHPDIKNDWTSVMGDGSTSFVDVAKSDWFYKYTILAESKKLLTGYTVDGQKMAKPTHTISRVEAAAMLSKLIGLK